MYITLSILYSDTRLAQDLRACPTIYIQFPTLQIAMPVATTPSIAILTFAVGGDYKRAMEPGMASKRAYAARHGYTFVEGGEDVWDRRKPIPWSKIRFILKYLDHYDFLFWSDGDVVITNPEICLEDLVLPLLPAGKDMLWCRDACGNLNNGNVLFRGRSAWARSFLERAYDQPALTHHIWWDNAAFIYLYETVPDDRRRIETCDDPARFNAYLFDGRNSAENSCTRLYKPGDFLVHLAGVYDIWNIHRFMIYINRCVSEGVAPDTSVLTAWRTAKTPPLNKEQAVHDGLSISIPGLSMLR